MFITTTSISCYPNEVKRWLTVSFSCKKCGNSLVQSDTTSHKQEHKWRVPEICWFITVEHCHYFLKCFLSPSHVRLYLFPHKEWRVSVCVGPCLWTHSLRSLRLCLLVERGQLQKKDTILSAVIQLQDQINLLLSIDNVHFSMIHWCHWHEKNSVSTSNSTLTRGDNAFWVSECHTCLNGVSWRYSPVSVGRDRSSSSTAFTPSFTCRPHSGC